MDGDHTVRDALEDLWWKFQQTVVGLHQRPEGDDRGANLVEYAFLLALITIVCLAAVTMLGQTTNSELYGKASSAFANAP